MSAPAKLPARFVETEIDDETLVMALDTGDFFSLRDSAREIWGLLDGLRGRGAIIDALAQRYDAPRDTLAAELDAFLAQLEAAGLLAPG